MARNEPRPGHSVLGVGTFEALKSALNPRPSPSPNPKPSPGLSPGRSPCPQTLTRAFRLTRRPSPPSRRWRCGSPSCDLSSTPTPSAPPSARRAPRSWACTGCTRRDPRICATARAALRPLSSRPCMTLELHCQRVLCGVTPVDLCRESCMWSPQTSRVHRARPRARALSDSRRATRNVARRHVAHRPDFRPSASIERREPHVSRTRTSKRARRRRAPARRGRGRATATRHARRVSRVWLWARAVVPCGACPCAARGARGAPYSAALVVVAWSAHAKYR